MASVVECCKLGMDWEEKKKGDLAFKSKEKLSEFILEMNEKLWNDFGQIHKIAWKYLQALTTIFRPQS